MPLVPPFVRPAALQLHQCHTGGPPASLHTVFGDAPCSSTWIGAAASIWPGRSERIPNRTPRFSEPAQSKCKQDTQIQRACAVEMHIDDVERRECAANSNEVVAHARFSDLSISCFSLTVRTPSVTTLFGENVLANVCHFPPHKGPTNPSIASNDCALVVEPCAFSHMVTTFRGRRKGNLVFWCSKVDFS